MGVKKQNKKKTQDKERGIVLNQEIQASQWYQTTVRPIQIVELQKRMVKKTKTQIK